MTAICPRNGLDDFACPKIKPLVGKVLPFVKVKVVSAALKAEGVIHIFALEWFAQFMPPVRLE